MIISRTAITPFSVKKVGSVFNLPSALHEWNYQNATDVGTTLTKVDTGSVGGWNTSNLDAASEPTLNSDNVEYNGTTQYTINNTANFRSADTTGVMHFKFIPTDNTSSQVNYIWASSDTALSSLVSIAYIDLKIRVNIRLGGSLLVLDTVSTMTLNTVNTVSIYSDGSTVRILLNGSLATLTLVLGTNDGRWFNYVTGRDNITSGAILTTVNIFSPSKQIYECYTSYVSGAATLTDHNLIRNTNF